MMKMKKLIFAAAFVLASALSFADINITFGGTTFSAFADICYDESANPHWDISADMDLAVPALGFSIDWEFKETEKGLHPYVGGFVGLADWNIMADGLGIGVTGGFYKHLFDTKIYNVELQVDGKVILSTDGLFVFHPSANLVFMDPSRKGWFFTTGIALPFCVESAIVESSTTPNSYYNLTDIYIGPFINLAIGYRF